MQKYRLISLLLFFFYLIVPCKGFTQKIFASSYPEKLSEWEMFTKTDTHLLLAPGVVPYDLINPLFSDYAIKFRTLWIPDQTQIQYKDKESLDFPIGSVISKTFSYEKDSLGLGNNLNSSSSSVAQESFLIDGIYLVETRILVKTRYGWVGLPYVWDDDQKDATLQLIGATKNLNLNVPELGGIQNFTYVVPNANQCKGCHIRHKDFKKPVLPIGPKAKHLNRDYFYVGGTENQLLHLQRLGMLAGLPQLTQVPKLAKWDDPNEETAARARAYLDINCSHCHNPHGPANTSGLHLEAEVNNLREIGICKTGVAIGNAGGNYKYDIHPGSPDTSILLFRLSSTNPSIMMPELGRSLQHMSGTALIHKWIDEMNPGCTDGQIRAYFSK